MHLRNASHNDQDAVIALIGEVYREYGDEFVLDLAMPPG